MSWHSDEKARIDQLIRTSEGARLLVKHRLLGYTQHTFRLNAIELANLIDAYEDPNTALERIRSDKPITDEIARRELIRRLHNFLASAKSLVEHTRNHMRELHSGTPLFTEYEDRVASTFSNSGISHFVQDLRNYSLHRGVPVVRETFRFEVGHPPTFRIFLDTERMSDWRKWSGPARSYIDSLPRHARLLDVIREYHDTVAEFHEWLDAARKAASEPAVERLRELQRQLRDLRPPRKA